MSLVLTPVSNLAFLQAIQAQAIQANLARNFLKQRSYSQIESIFGPIRPVWVCEPDWPPAFRQQIENQHFQRRCSTSGSRLPYVVWTRSSTSTVHETAVGVQLVSPASLKKR
jgi:hypothetical protein